MSLSFARPILTAPGGNSPSTCLAAGSSSSMSRGFPPQFRRGHPPAAVRPWVAGKSAAPVAVRWVATTVAHRWGIAAVVPMAERRVSGWWPVEAVVAGRSRACRSAAGRRWATLPRTGWAGVSTSSGVVARPNPGGGPLRSPAPDRRGFRYGLAGHRRCPRLAPDGY